MTDRNSAAYLQGCDAGRLAAQQGSRPENPYREPRHRDAWAQGFAAAYSEFRARTPYGDQ